MQEYMRASQEELLAHEDTRTEVTKEYIESIRKREIALVPLLLCKLFARQANIAEFKDYLADIIRRFFSKNISAQDMEDLCRSLAISIDKSICYDDLQQNKSVKYYYAIDSWLSADQHIPLREFKLKVPEEYHFFLHEGLTAAFKKAQLAGCSLENAVYLLKTSFFPMAQDRIFYYLRVPKIEGRDQAQKKTGISKGA
jgi:hypothetical protein